MANRKNIANGILAANLTTSATTMTLETGYGSGMPAVPFSLTITPTGQLSTAGNSEIVTVTARSGDTLTITRAQKGTTAKAFTAGAVVANGIYADEKWGADNIDFETLKFGNYSTSEVDTGFTWIDGKKIYKKTINCGSLPNVSTTNTPHGIVYDYIVSFSGTAKLGTGTIINLPHVSESTEMGPRVPIYITTTNIVIVSGSDRSGSRAYVTIYYTKPV